MQSLTESGAIKGVAHSGRPTNKSVGRETGSAGHARPELA
eukprot:COSAG01_NODE_75444_length_196_cov_24.494845_1_plen_39_part_10